METRAYFNSILDKVIESRGQDLFLKSGAVPHMRIGGDIIPLPFKPVSKEEMSTLAREVLTPLQWQTLEDQKSVDFGFSYEKKACRFRGNAFYQQGALSLVFRMLWQKVPTFEELHLPAILKKVALERSGIILIAGAVSSGKTTTIAAMLRAMNENVQKHVITLEDPIEYQYEDGKCLIQQREVGEDTKDFDTALKYIVRQSPDVIVIGEMRDSESFSFALSAAEVGRLVISSLHAQSVPQVFDRVLDFFPPEHRDAVLRHFAMNISCIAVQKLLVGTDGKSLVPAVEVLLGNYTVRQLILEKRLDKLPQALRNGTQEGMRTMDQAIYGLFTAGLVSKETALAAGSSAQELEALMKGIRIGQDTKILGE